jgi:hypothetical protein
VRGRGRPPGRGQPTGGGALEPASAAADDNAWLAGATQTLRGGGAGAAQVLALAEAAATRAPAPHDFAEALCGAAAAALARPATAGGFSAPAAVALAAALTTARVPAPAPLRAALAARIEGGAWELTAAALAAAAGRLQGMGHVWSVPAARAFVARAAEAHEAEAEGAPLGGAASAGAVADLLLALQPALLQAPLAPGPGGTASGCDALLRLWAGAVDEAVAAAERWLDKREEAAHGGSRSGGSGGGDCSAAGAAAGGAARDAALDPVPALLALLRTLQALQPVLRPLPASRALVAASLRACGTCALPQLVPLAAAWRGLGVPLPQRALLRLSREPVSGLSSAKLAALADALAHAQPSARGARAAVSALAAEAAARARAGRLPPPAAAQAVAALPRLLRLGWPADAGAALLAALEPGAAALPPAQLWELHAGLERLAPLWEAAAVTVTHTWGPATSAAPAPAPVTAAAPRANGLLPRPVYPQPAANPPASPDAAVAVVPLANEAGASPAHAALQQLERVQAAVRSALAAVPAERLPVGAAPPALGPREPSGGAGAAEDNGAARPLSPRRQALAMLQHLRRLLASPALTPSGLAAACAGVARLFGPGRLRRAARAEPRQLDAARRSLEAAVWVWLQASDSTSSSDGSGSDGSGSDTSMDAVAVSGTAAAVGAQSAAGSLGATQLMLALRALVALGADPHSGVADDVTAAAHAALRRMPPPRLASALRALAGLQLPHYCPAWEVLLLRLLVAHVPRMVPWDALPCVHAIVMGLRFRPAPAVASQLMQHLLAPAALARAPPGALLQAAQLAAALRAACAGAPTCGAAAEPLPARALAPLLQVLAARMARLSGREIVAAGAAVAAWGAPRVPGFGEWMEAWLVLLRARALQLSTAEVGAGGRLRRG